MTHDVEVSSPPDVAPGASYEHASRAGDFIFLSVTSPHRFGPA